MVTETSSKRLAALFDAWQEHCYAMPAERHKPAIEGGKARYGVNAEVTLIWCTYRGCTWSHEVQS